MNNITHSLSSEVIDNNAPPSLSTSSNNNTTNRQIQNDNDLSTLNIINDLPFNTIQHDFNNNNFIDYIKIGELNIRQGYLSKLNDIHNLFILNNYSILGLTETGFSSNSFSYNKYTDLINYLR